MQSLMCMVSHFLDNMVHLLRYVITNNYFSSNQKIAFEKNRFLSGNYRTTHFTTTV